MTGINEIIISLVGISTVIGILISIKKRTDGLGQEILLKD